MNYPTVNDPLPVLAGLTSLELADLGRLEGNIDSRLAVAKSAFVEIARDLTEIKGRKLYRASGLTWEDYCRQRFGFSEQYAGNLLRSAAVVQNLMDGTTGPKTPTTVGVLPSSEGVTRPLTALPSPSQQRSAWADAVANAPSGMPTAADTAAAVARVFDSLSSDQQDRVLASEHKRNQQSAAASARPDPDDQRARKCVMHLKLARNRIYHHSRGSLVVDKIDEALVLVEELG